jgi:hypothetical protein
MNSRNHISDELRALNSGLQENLNNLPYSVPDGYFEGLAEAVLKRIRDEQNLSAASEISELSPLLAQLSRKMPFEVPEGYFGENTGAISSIVKEEEESLVLSFISREMPYQVPLGYFANLPGVMLDRVRKENKTTLKPVIGRKWMRMAAAAFVAGIITISGLFYFNNRGGSTGGTGVASEFRNVSSEELDAFIKNTTGTVPSAADVTSSTATAEVKKILDKVSDQELEAFLEEVPTEDLPLVDEDEELLFN